MKKKIKKAKPVNLRIHQKDLERITHNANIYAEGNVSKWIRYAAIHCVPKPGDLE